MTKVKKSESGQMIIFVIIILALVLVNAVLLATGSLTLFQSSNYSVERVQATELAEAAIDKAVASINQSAGSYSGESETALGPGSYSVEITTINPTTRLVQATGYIPNKTNPTATKTVSIQLATGTGVAFNYAVQVGEGGLVMGANSSIEGTDPRYGGSVYSNGSITMAANAKITGDAFVAGGVQATANQQSECPPVSCSDYIFGKTAGGELDIAQSFIPTTNTVLNKVSLKLRKVGNPPNLPVRIMYDAFGPDRTRPALATAIIPANLITTAYNWVDVVFQTPPNLLINPYWIVLDTTADSNNYWMWSMDTNPFNYTSGRAMWSRNYTNQPWTNINGDMGFKTYMGGIITSITGAANVTIGHMDGFTRVGDAHANLLSNLNVTRDTYYSQFATNVTTGGTAHPNSPDPPLQPMAISQGNVEDWKVQAEEAGVFNIGYISSCMHNIPAGRYNGFISFPANCNATVGSPVYITQGMWLSGNNTLTLNSSYGASSGVILTDGEITMYSNNRALGSGTPGSYLMLLSNRDSTSDLRNAISVNSNGNSGILQAPRGIISLGSNNSLTEISAWRLLMGSNVRVTYDQGLANTFFSTGPTGSYSAVKGTYQSK